MRGEQELDNGQDSKTVLKKSNFSSDDEKIYWSEQLSARVSKELVTRTWSVKSNRKPASESQMHEWENLRTYRQRKKHANEEHCIWSQCKIVEARQTHL